MPKKQNLIRLYELRVCLLVLSGAVAIASLKNWPNDKNRWLFLPECEFYYHDDLPECVTMLGTEKNVFSIIKRLCIILVSRWKTVRSSEKSILIIILVYFVDTSKSRRRRWNVRGRSRQRRLQMIVQRVTSYCPTRFVRNILLLSRTVSYCAFIKGCQTEYPYLIKSLIQE